MKKDNFKETFLKHEGNTSDKWHHYLEAYSDLLSDLAPEVSNVLEIGIQNGGSLEVWGEFFPRVKNIVGIDIDKKCAELNFSSPKIQVILGDANQDETFSKVVIVSHNYDIVIDDGSHVSSDIVKSLIRYLPLVAKGGIYIIEDLHASYWEAWEGGLGYRKSSNEFLKQIVDVVNYEHWGIPANREDVFPFFQEEMTKQFLDSLEGIKEVRFSNSLCIILMDEPEKALLGQRVVRGETAKVNPLVLEVDGHVLVAPDQTSNQNTNHNPRLVPIPRSEKNESDGRQGGASN